MTFLIAYGTTEGQTQKIVKTIANQIRELGHEVKLFDTSNLQGDMQPEAFDKIIIAGSVHEKCHQEALELFAMANHRQLQVKPTIFISVSLAAAFEDGLAEAQGYVDGFIEKTGWRPGQNLLVAGALRHGEYGYFKEQILKFFVLKNRKLKNPQLDHEFTDWNLLKNAVADFAQNDAEPIDA